MNQELPWQSSGEDCLSLLLAQVRSLARELKSHKLHRHGRKKHQKGKHEPKLSASPSPSDPPSIRGVNCHSLAGGLHHSGVSSSSVHFSVPLLSMVSVPSFSRFLAPSSVSGFLSPPQLVSVPLPRSKSSSLWGPCPPPDPGSWSSLISGFLPAPLSPSPAFSPDVALTL